MTRPLLPFTQFVVKVHSRCDLACDHCYVYEHADTSWRARPKVIGEEVLTRAARRIGEHAAAHGLTVVRVVLHGGEPLLAGPERLRRAAEEFRAALPPGCALDLRIHTNGVLLGPAFCELFDELEIKVGVSLDGDRAANDRHRRFADGRSSHPQVLRAVGLLRRPEYRHLYAGLLCTVDVENDPVAVHDALAELDPPSVDFLLPHATWEQPPARPAGRGETPYADWLLAVYDRWEAAGRPFAVRTFDSVHRTLHGLSSLTESLGLEPAALVVLETDGTYEQADSLKTAYDGAPVTGLDVFTHSLDEVARHPGMAARQSGLAGLSATCRACPVVRSCGGGLYAHRYGADGGFDHPSVYCGDLMTLINGIADRGEPAGRPGTTPRAAAGRAVPAQPGEPAPPAGLTDRQLDRLARGHGDADTVRALVRSQLALTRAMLAAVRSTSGLRSSAAWDLLADLDSTAPAALDAVLGHPYVRAWAARRLGGDPGAGLGRLAELAAAAAVRAGRGDAVAVPVRAGGLHLPTLGRIGLGGGGEAIVTGTGDGFTVRTADGEVLTVGEGRPDPRFEPVRRVRPAGGWTFALEDADPQRDSHQWPVADRLGEAELLAWTGALREAVELLDRDLPAFAEGMRTGLTTVTPLRPGPPGRDVSAAARQAFGAVGIARPATAPTLALLLAHEFQHVKLGAVLDLVDLYDPADTALYDAPWRPDPRPIEGLLQGTYAHLAVTAFWRTRTAVYDGLPGTAAEHARAQFALWRRYTAEAVERLAGSGSLTPVGLRFADGMRETVGPWLDVALPAAAETAAEQARQARRPAAPIG
ncbi:FxsB family cyclophane-forming radical SAM/SPASM peptide maturase [Kitasatospora sp. A2-31]|uniref:FxsB family cyclophane-forming radical SAM/SPASM peptide maturase n=2 Tax=Kitasatospora sp. A2-31 TaxID=2916414 RepID=UPI001EEBD9E5|nr:FxsB family cyclophane-forming radical SAM/SPASM peptide maturase [Kitasatospora sp. A2-31]MCG6495101.1 FxsB family radical SAM/SPASM domain protein [Kitasatospora sp. A2-31]